MKVEICCNHSFLPALIRPRGVVIDIGVHSGGFSSGLANRCRRVIGFEPDSSWQGRYSLPPNVVVLPEAIAVKNGTVQLSLNPRLCSSLHYRESSSASVNVGAVTLADALALEPEGLIDLVKMDIEGEELGVLEHAPTEALARIVQLTVEFHDFLDHASLPRIKAVIKRMRLLGFQAVKFSWRSYGDVLFVSQQHAPLSLGQRFWLRFRYKYGSGTGRMLKRVVGL